jgi:hypothetical protein
MERVATDKSICDNDEYKKRLAELSPALVLKVMKGLANNLKDGL